MAVKLGSDNNDLDVNHEINVTPFIDVILVLLIVFMIAAPLATVDIPVDLPKAVAQPQPKPDEPIYLSIKADLSLTLGEEPVAREVLGHALDLLTESDREQRIMLRGDRSIAYGDLMSVMNDLRRAGYLKIALVGLEDTSGGVAPTEGQQPTSETGTP